MAAVLSSCMLGAVFLRTHKSLESVDPQFTMRRKMEQLREELELMEQLREVRASLSISFSPSLSSGSQLPIQEHYVLGLCMC